MAANTVPSVFWEEPGGSRRSKGTPAIAPNQIDLLKANPNEWGRIGAWNRKTVAGTLCSRLRQGKGGIPLEEVPNYEFRAEKAPDNSSSKLFARYVGEPTTPPEQEPEDG